MGGQGGLGTDGFRQERKMQHDSAELGVAPSPHHFTQAIHAGIDTTKKPPVTKVSMITDATVCALLGFMSVAPSSSPKDWATSMHSRLVK